MRWKDYELPLGLSIDPEDHAPLLSDYVRCGFHHFELQMPAYGTQPENTATDMLAMIEPNLNRLTALSIRPWSLHLPFGRDWDIAARDEAQRRIVVKKLMDIILGVQEWGIRVLTLHPGLEPVQDEDRPIRALRSACSIRELHNCAAPLGMQIAVEDLPRSCLGNTSEELEALMNAAPGVGCCFDVNHLLKESHATFLSRLAHRVIQTHLSDYDSVDERHWLPGQGIVPFGLIADSLQQAGYRGPYLFELHDVVEPKILIEAFQESLEKNI